MSIGEFVEIKASGNTARFMPGRVGRDADDTQIGFGGLRYSRQAQETPTGFIAGIAIGPGQHMPKDEPGAGFKLSDGGVIVPAHPNEKRETVPVRDFVPKQEKSGRAKQYVDWATFKVFGADLFRAVPYEQDKTFNFEVWSGDFAESGGEGNYQLIQANLFTHGSVAYSGGTVVVHAPSKKRGQKGVVAPSDVPDGIRASQAQMVKERLGTMVGGIPLWLARLWAVQYSSKDSETILVCHFDRYFLLLLRNGKPGYIEVPASAFEKDFGQLAIDQKLIGFTPETMAA